MITIDETSISMWIDAQSGWLNINYQLWVVHSCTFMRITMMSFSCGISNKLKYANNATSAHRFISVHWKWRFCALTGGLQCQSCEILQLLASHHSSRHVSGKFSQMLIEKDFASCAEFAITLAQGKPITVTQLSWAWFTDYYDNHVAWHWTRVVDEV